MGKRKKRKRFVKELIESIRVLEGTSLALFLLCAFVLFFSPSPSRSFVGVEAKKKPRDYGANGLQRRQLKHNKASTSTRASARKQACVPARVLVSKTLVFNSCCAREEK